MPSVSTSIIQAAVSIAAATATDFEKKLYKALDASDYLDSYDGAFSCSRFNDKSKNVQGWEFIIDADDDDLKKVQNEIKKIATAVGKPEGYTVKVNSDGTMYLIAGPYDPAKKNDMFTVYE